MVLRHSSEQRVRHCGELCKWSLIKCSCTRVDKFRGVSLTYGAHEGRGFHPKHIAYFKRWKKPTLSYLYQTGVVHSLRVSVRYRLTTLEPDGLEKYSFMDFSDFLDIFEDTQPCVVDCVGSINKSANETQFVGIRYKAKIISQQSTHQLYHINVIIS